MLRDDVLRNWSWTAARFRLRLGSKACLGASKYYHDWFSGVELLYSKADRMPYSSVAVDPLNVTDESTA